LTFLDEKPNKGLVNIENLRSDTLYLFTLSCEGTDETITRNIRTDYGRPSLPENTTVILNLKRLTISWLPPLVPAGPIYSYRLIIDKNPIINDLPNTQFSYEMKEDYVYGTRHTFTVLACNKDRENSTVCSNEDEAEVSFFLQAITTTTTSSTGILSCSIFFPVLIFSFFLFSQMKY
jgi:hypothetical protein